MQKHLVFLGSDAIGLDLLSHLSSNNPNWKLGAVVSQPDRPVGRGRRLTPNPVAAFAREKKLELFQPISANQQLAPWLREKGFDCGLVFAYGQIVSAEALSVCSMGLFNFHGSLLPELRGASPIETAIATGQTKTGMCFMKMVPAMDAGPVADANELPISTYSTSPELRREMGRAAVQLWKKVHPSLFDNHLAFQEQDHDQSTYCRKILKLDGRADFRLRAAELQRRWRAFYPWPGLWFQHNDSILKVGNCSVEESQIPLQTEIYSPGTVLKPDERAIRIATGEGILRVQELQRPGGRMLPARDFLRGYQLSEGTLLESFTNPPLIRKGSHFPKSFFNNLSE